MTRVYQIKGYYIRQRLDYKTANGFLNTLNPKLSYIDTVLIIFQTVRWYGGTGGSRVGHGWVTGGSRVGHRWVTGGSQVGHGWVTGGSRVGHGWVTGGSQVGHGWVTGGSQVGHGWVTGGSRVGLLGHGVQR